MIRIGILGCGRIVINRYIEVFQKEISKAKVILVCDKIEKKAYYIAKLLDCKSTCDENILFNSNDLDLILVCTESGNHFKHSKKALNAGKHVIVEKPPALTPLQIIEIDRIAKKKNLMFAVIFQNRFNPAMVKLKEAFTNNRFGKVSLATIRLRWCRYQDYYEDGWHGTWKFDGGVISQQAIHHIDALQWICGEVDEVCSKTGNMLNHLEAEDTMTAITKFKSGAMGAIEATTAARPEDFEASLSIIGERGMVEIGGIALNKINKWIFVDPKAEDKNIPEDFSLEVPSGYGLSHGPLIQEIINRLIDKNLSPPISGSDCLHTLAIIHALYVSDENRSWVKLEEKPVSRKLGLN